MAAPSRVAIIGLGIMGSAIARNLIAAGFSVSGFDVDAGKMARARDRWRRHSRFGCRSGARRRSRADVAAKRRGA